MAFQAVAAEENWCESEFASIELGDERLNRRFISFAQRILSNPESSINEACIGWAETKAAYRMLDNEKLDPDCILEAHRESLAVRIKGQKTVLAIQDTTYFRFDALVDLRKEAPRRRFRDMHGIVMHHCLAVSPDGLPYGQIFQKLYDRDVGSYYGGHYDHQKIPIEQKESFRWIEGLRATQDFSENHDVNFVTLADRECDIYEFLQEATILEADFVIRAAKDRRTAEHSYAKAPEKKIWYMTESAPSAGSFELDLNSKSRKGRAELSVRYCRLSLKPAKRLPGAKSNELRPIDVTCILAREESPPEGCDAIEWLLLSNLPVDSFEEAREKISWYEKRWTIESYHKVLKSGFQAEKCQLRTPERLYRYISILAVLAIRLYELSHLARVEPNAPCTVILQEKEWRALEHKVRRGQNPTNTPPSLSDAITWIAILGGYLNRKSDPPPGSMVIWRGWRRMQDIVDTWVAFNETYG